MRLSLSSYLLPVPIIALDICQLPTIPILSPIFRGVHRLEGPVDGFYGGAVLPMTHRRRRVSAWWRRRVSICDDERA